MKPSLRLFRSALLILAATLALGATGQPAAKRVAIVMDDGPTPEQNAPMLALFAREKVRITFAHVGRQVAANPAMAKAAAEAGHEIINHSYTHPHFKKFDDAAITKEVRDTQEAVRAATGRTPRWFWSPYGDWDDRIAAAVRVAGLEHYPAPRFTFLDTRDWDAATTAEQFHERATKGVGEKTVLLMHEWPKVTLATLPAVIAELKRQNVEFVTFSELEAAK